MKNILKNPKKGITLTEVIIVIALIGIVLSVIYSLLFFGKNTFNISRRQYGLQSDMRFSLDTIVREVRFSSELDILSVDDARDSSNHLDGYSYFYIYSGRLYHVIYDENIGSHRIISYGRNLNSQDSIFRKVDSTTLEIKLFSEDERQRYDATSFVGLPNLQSNGNSILGLEEGLGIRYR